ncbi:MAG: M23 family metallopeptidase [Rikenellaceae bacterium]
MIKKILKRAWIRLIKFTRGVSRARLLIYTLYALLALILVLSVVLLFRRCSSCEGEVYSYDQNLPDARAIARQEAILGFNAKQLYGITVDNYELESDDIQSGETFSKLLNGKYNVNIAVINKLIEKCNGVFDLRDLRAGQPYTAFISRGDTSESLSFLIYEKNRTEFITFAMEDSIYVHTAKKNVVVEERYKEGVIESTLYGSVGALLSNEMAEVYESTIDFGAIQQGDGYRVLYEEQFIDTTSIGIGKVYGIEITHKGVAYTAIRYEQGETKGYWDEKGNNMKKAFLRSPLSYKARVTSKFGSRIHPIKRIRQQHNGIDYAAPVGTPVLAVADGTVSRKGWDSGGGGNILFIKHSQGLESGYLHLSRYPSGIAVGTRVKKGQVVAYTGNTGGSTGPHLDFRIKQNGKYINPDKIPTTPGDPINEANRAGFNVMRDDVLRVMEEYSSSLAR